MFTKSVIMMKSEVKLMCKLNATFGLCRRFLCTNIKDHPYDKVIAFESNHQLANHLCDNILYDKNGIIVMNKPYGICFSRDNPQWKNLVNKKNPTIIRHKLVEITSKPRVTVEEDNVNLHNAMPYIKSRLNCETLCVIRSPEKYTSGVCILGCSEKIRSKVKKCWERSRAQKTALESYLAICSGVPIKSYVNNYRIGVTLHVSESGKSKRAILSKNYSKNDILKGKVKVATVHSFLLNGKDDLASLVQIVTNQKKWHFVRLFLASELLAPAIGDHLFGSRVKKLMGTTIPVDHWSDCASQSQKLDPDLLSKLNLHPGSEKYIPAMIHLSEVRLIQFLRNSEDLLLSAPPLPYFSWTMDKLGLHIPENSLPLVKHVAENVKKSSVN